MLTLYMQIIQIGISAIFRVYERKIDADGLTESLTDRDIYLCRGYCGRDVQILVIAWVCSSASSPVRAWSVSLVRCALQQQKEDN